jgi:flagellar biosynthesis protein FliQ
MPQRVRHDTLMKEIRMDSLEAIEIGRQAIFVFLKIAAPLMLISLAVGLLISLFQALTQIQEMTLTFVPKIIVMFATLIFLMPFILHTLTDFTHEMNARIVTIGRQGNE